MKIDVRQPPAGTVIGSTEADASVVNSTAETTLVTFSTPLGLAIGDRLILRASGDMNNNTGSAATFTFRFKLGATTVIASNAASIATGSQRRKWWREYVVAIKAIGGSPVQLASVSSMISASTSDQESIGTGVPGVGGGSATEDLSTSKNALLTVQLGTADANADCVLKQASLVRLWRSS